MYTGRLYGLSRTLRWSRGLIVAPFLWSLVVTLLFEGLELRYLAIPPLPLTLVGTAVAFHLGFKNSSSYERLWEARKIWGAIVNASRSWAYGARDLIGVHAAETGDPQLQGIREELVRRHVAWMDALRHQLRKPRSWEHHGREFETIREVLPERNERLLEVLRRHVDSGEAERVLGQLNPAAHLLAHQSRRLAELRRAELLDGFSHVHLQGLLDELMTQQGKAERIKNFPFPRQYATVNHFFAHLFALMLPFGLLRAFADMGPHLVWMAIPFSTAVSWVFLTTDRIGDWSENPFEGLPNDVPISTLSRAIERDILQLVGVDEVPPARENAGLIHM